MKLYYMPGACSLSPHIVLNEAGLAFDKVKVDGKTKATDAGGDYRTVNPLGYVPLLELDDGTKITEGPAIVQYIADKVPAKKLAPANGTPERTKLQSWLNFVSTEVHKGFSPLFNPAMPEEAKIIAKERLATRFAHLEAHFAKNDYIMGKAFSVPDAYAFTVLRWTAPTKIDLAPYPHIQKFMARMQNRSETNTFTLKQKDEKTGEEQEIVSGNDGGAFYSPGHGKVPLVKRADGKYEVKSYGSMTYALVKCLMFAGAKPDDPRVLAAVGWISKNFAIERNPGFETEPNAAKNGQQGYYYYLRTMTRALAEVERASGKAMKITDANGKAHDWRREVAAKLVSLQHPDGAWVNSEDRWEEASPILATSFAMEALATCQGRLP